MKTEYSSFEEFFADLEEGQVYHINVTNDVEYYEDTSEKKEALVNGPKTPPETPKKRKRIRPTLIAPIKKKRVVIDLTEE